MTDKQIISDFNFPLDFKKRGKVAGPGTVKAQNVRFVRALWPNFDQPTKLFTDDSSGLEIQGPPTPRNIIFPRDTVFLPVIVNRAAFGEPPRWEVTDIPTKYDCYFVRNGDEITDLTPEQVLTEWS